MSVYSELLLMEQAELTKLAELIRVKLEGIMLVRKSKRFGILEFDLRVFQPHI